MWKYIMLASNHQPVPVIFPSLLTHSAVAEGIQWAGRSQERMTGRYLDLRKPTSAGFLGSVEANLLTGESESLGLKSAPADLATINAIGIQAKKAGSIDLEKIKVIAAELADRGSNETRRSGRRILALLNGEDA